MTVSDYERTVGIARATPSQREAGAFLDLLGLSLGFDYTLENCEEWAAALLGHPSPRLVAHLLAPRRLPDLPPAVTALLPPPPSTQPPSHPA